MILTRYMQLYSSNDRYCFDDIRPLISEVAFCTNLERQIADWSIIIQLGRIHRAYLYQFSVLLANEFLVKFKKISENPRM